jgi:hypothetical protein
VTGVNLVRGFESLPLRLAPDVWPDPTTKGPRALRRAAPVGGSCGRPGYRAAVALSGVKPSITSISSNELSFSAVPGLSGECWMLR